MFEQSVFDGIVTEPPYAAEYIDQVMDAFSDCKRVLKPGMSMVWLVSSEQRPGLLERADEHNLMLTLDQPLRRKGIRSSVLRWQLLI